MSDEKPGIAQATNERMAAMDARYQAERAKRLRTDGNAQFREMTGALARFADDPYADPTFERAPITREVDVLIIGGGLSGILTGAHLHKQGVDNVLLVEKAGDFGGTWYWNRYPGAACDVESYIYLPMLEEIGQFPRHKYARAPDIKRHFEQVAEAHGLRERSLMQTAVTEARWDEARARWNVETSRGDHIAARFVVSAGGLLQRPKLPGIPGIERYRGHSFHTSRWDYSYTGGSSEGGLENLRDKRVAIIGTGSTAIQCVPPLADYSQHLYVVQRTPASVFPRDNQETAQEWVDALEQGWQARRTRNFSRLLGGFPEEEDIIGDWWTKGAFGPTVNDIPGLKDLDPATKAEKAMFLRMEECRARVDAVVADPETAESLKPYYPYFCKRPAFHDEYLECFNRPNVTLIDTKGEGVEQITEKGFIVAGVEREVDCIVYSTGFEFTADEKRRLDAEFYGRGDLKLSDKFRDGASTFQGIHTHGFPNLLRISTAQTGTTFNYTHIATALATHLAHIVRTCLDENIRAIEAEEAAEKDWVDTIIRLGGELKAFLLACTPSYLNREGRISDADARNFTYGNFSGGIEYMHLLESWRGSGDMPGLRKSYQ